MKSRYILGLWIVMSSLAVHAQNDYTTYQVAFRKGGVMTISEDLTEVTVTPTSFTGRGEVRQQWMIKRMGGGKLLIASPAAPGLFLKRNGSAVTMQPYDADEHEEYLWVVSGTVSHSHTVGDTPDGPKLLALLADPSDRQQVLTSRANGLLQVATVRYDLADDPYRIYMVKVTSPGSF
ncbi:MAG: hypothetical protein AAGA66_02875 [Bacteroidota bacterium]